VKTTGWLIALLIVAAVAAFGGFWFGHNHESAHEEEAGAATTEEAEPKPIARVVVAPLKRGSITSLITAYGSIVAQPGDVRVISVPFESKIVRTMVTAGQQVSQGTELVRIGPSPDVLVALQEAKNAAEAAGRDLKQVEQRFADHLATNQELSQAQQAARSAELKLQSLQQRGVAEEQTLKADAAGIVGKVNVQEGQIVAAGTGLLEIASGNRIEAALAVDPADAMSLKVDQPVRLSIVGGSRESTEAMDGKIRVVGRRVDPATRMATVIATVPPDAQLMLDTFVQGQITRASAEGLIVPREAVLPEEEGAFVLFTAENGHAKKHEVRIGLENDRETQVIAEENDALKPGDPVVVQGNYSLEDGMEVQITGPATTSPTSTMTTTAPGAALGARQSSPSPRYSGERAGERGERRSSSRIVRFVDQHQTANRSLGHSTRTSPLSPTLSPAYRGEGEKRQPGPPEAAP
jgi:RND family efflux transporter MFP subunit